MDPGRANLTVSRFSGQSSPLLGFLPGSAREGCLVLGSERYLAIDLVLWCVETAGLEWERSRPIRETGKRIESVCVCWGETQNFSEE